MLNTSHIAQAYRHSSIFVRPQPEKGHSYDSLIDNYRYSGAFLYKTIDFRIVFRYFTAMAAHFDINVSSVGAIASIGEAVRYHRRRSGLSQHALADLAGVGKTSVFDIEKGKTTVRLTTLVAVLNALNISISLASPLMKEFSERSQGPMEKTP